MFDASIELTTARDDHPAETAVCGKGKVILPQTPSFLGKSNVRIGYPSEFQPACPPQPHL